MAEIKQFVGLKLGKEKFGIDIMSVEEIQRPMEITTVPKAPHFVEGIINLRGRVIPIVDLRKKLNLMANEFDKETRIVVVSVRSRQLGFVVDSVEQVISVPADIIDRAPAVNTSFDSNYIAGVARMEQGMIIILDVSKIFTPSEENALNRF